HGDRGHGAPSARQDVADPGADRFDPYGWPMEIRLPGVRWPRSWRPRRTAAAAAAVVVLAGAGTWGVVASDDAPAVRRADRVMAMEGGVRIDTSYFTSGGDGRRPAVLLGHGFGGSKEDVREQAEKLARDGYAVLTWSARGFGKSTGKIGLNDPEGEVADVSRLIDRSEEHTSEL